MSKTKFGLGLAAIGRPEYINIRDNYNIDKSYENFKKNANEILNFAYDNGIRYFDTAPSYGKGELFLKNWNEKHTCNDVVLSTKWGYTYVANWKLGYTGKHEIKEHSINKLTEQWQKSKELLPNLKIYQIHSATIESGVLKNESVLNELYRLKKKYNLQIGLSSSGFNQTAVIEEALLININNESLFDSFQITFNFLESSTYTILEKLKKQGKTLIIKEPLANGRIFLKPNKIVAKLAKKYKVGLDAIALRFIIDLIEPNYLLSGAFSKKQLKENLKALNFKLQKDEIENLKLLQVKPKTYWEERSNLTWS